MMSWMLYVACKWKMINAFNILIRKYEGKSTWEM